MRKILSGLLATAMVTSLCATMASAVDTVAATSSEIAIDFSKVTLEEKDNNGNAFVDANTVSKAAHLVITTSNGGKIDIEVPATKILKSSKPADLVNYFKNDGTISIVNVKDAGGNNVTALTPSANGSRLILTTTNTGKNSEIGVKSVELTPGPSDDGFLDFANTSVSVSTSVGLNEDKVTVDAEGDLLKKVTLDQVIECKRNGDPRALTEDPAGVDKDLNGGDGVQSGKTLYFMVKDGDFRFDDDTYWKLKITKGDNGKLIKKISDVSKVFSNDLYDVETGNQVPGTGVDRHRYIKVELNEIYTDDEYKITLDLRLSPKSKAIDVFGTDYKLSDGDEVKVSDFSFYMKNMVKDADNDWNVGIGGLMLNPLENDWNEVTYYDEDGDVAFMKFFADSDVDKFYAKLSTKWEHADYASYFNDQDAFIFNFTGSPKMSSTSRCDLQIYNPFVDDDGNETIDPATAVVYQVIDGDLYDVTDSFKYEEGDNGDMAFTTRTRFLGTYIICEKAVEEAVADETVPDELTPDTDTGAPEETTPDNSNSGKTPANTGRYL